MCGPMDSCVCGGGEGFMCGNLCKPYYSTLCCNSEPAFVEACPFLVLCHCASPPLPLSFVVDWYRRWP